MSFATEKAANEALNEYVRLTAESTKIQNVAQLWMDRATTLHGTVDVDKKAEIVASRDALKSALQAILNAN